MAVSRSTEITRRTLKLVSMPTEQLEEMLAVSDDLVLIAAIKRVLYVRNFRSPLSSFSPGAGEAK